jgi:hypothetical protein
MQLEKLTDKSKDEILILWQQYHATKVSKTQPIRTVITKSHHRFMYLIVFFDGGRRRIAVAFRFRPRRVVRF